MDQSHDLEKFYHHNHNILNLLQLSQKHIEEVHHLDFFQIQVELDHKNIF